MSVCKQSPRKNVQLVNRPSENTAIKFKRKLQFRGHVYFEAVRPEFIMSALNWLKANNPLYKDIQIDCTNISVQLTDMTQADNDDTSLQTKK